MEDKKVVCICPKCRTVVNRIQVGPFEIIVDDALPEDTIVFKGMPQWTCLEDKWNLPRK